MQPENMRYFKVNYNFVEAGRLFGPSQFIKIDINPGERLLEMIKDRLSNKAIREVPERFHKDICQKNVVYLRQKDKK